MIDLASKVLVVRPRITMVGKSVTDESITTEVSSNHDLGKEAGAWVKKLYPPGESSPSRLARLTSISAAARKYHRLRTLRSSFGDLLPSVLFADYDEQMNRFIREFDEEANDFALNFDTVISECRQRLNGTFDIRNYPPAATVRSCFSFQLFTGPLPRNSDIMIQYLGAEHTAQVKASLQQQVEQASQQAVKQTIAKVMEHVNHITEVLAKPKPKIYDSLIDNLSEILNLVPAFNLSNDPILTDLVARCRADLEVAPDMLRDSSVHRHIVGQRAKSIATEFGGMGNRKLAA
jgi:hypothetical protein